LALAAAASPSQPILPQPILLHSPSKDIHPPRIDQCSSTIHPTLYLDDTRRRNKNIVALPLYDMFIHCLPLFPSPCILSPSWRRHPRHDATRSSNNLTSDTIPHSGACVRVSRTAREPVRSSLPRVSVPPNALLSVCSICSFGSFCTWYPYPFSPLHVHITFSIFHDFI